MTSKKKKVSKFNKSVNKVGRASGGKSKPKHGDVKQLASEFFKECALDPGFLAHGLALADAKLKRRRSQWVAYKNRQKKK